MFVKIGTYLFRADLIRIVRPLAANKYAETSPGLTVTVDDGDGSTVYDVLFPDEATRDAAMAALEVFLCFDLASSPSDRPAQNVGA